MTPPKRPRYLASWQAFDHFKPVVSNERHVSALASPIVRNRRHWARVGKPLLLWSNYLILIVQAAAVHAAMHFPTPNFPKSTC